VRTVSSWALKTGTAHGDLGDAVAAMRDGVNKLRAGIQDAIPDFMREEAARTKAELMAHAVPEKLAGEVAALGSTMLAPDICHVAAVSGTDLKRAMKTFFSVTEAFRIGRIMAAIDRIPVSDHFEGLALARSLDEISEARRIISSTALDSNPDAPTRPEPGLQATRIASAMSQSDPVIDRQRRAHARKADRGCRHDERPCPFVATVTGSR
jgi:glutamate dehydrogenase